MPEFFDHSWRGKRAAVDKAMATFGFPVPNFDPDSGKPPAKLAEPVVAVLGPVTTDEGTDLEMTWIRARATAPLDVPRGLQLAGEQVAVYVVGDWAYSES